jgi:T5SS/PEP-CTERM-associated repeat protein
MHTYFRPIHFLTSLRQLSGLLIVVTLLLGLATSAHAEVVAFGDVDPDTDPDLPLFGSPLDGNDDPIPTDLITVGTGEDGIGRLVIDVPAFTLPLVSQGTNADTIGAIVGEGPSAIGEVVITGLGSEWEVRGTSIIGDQGLAFMSLLAGARVLVFRVSKRLGSDRHSRRVWFAFAIDVSDGGSRRRRFDYRHQPRQYGYDW